MVFAMPTFRCLRHLIVEQHDVSTVLKMMGSMALLETVHLSNKKFDQAALRCISCRLFLLCFNIAFVYKMRDIQHHLFT